MPMLFVTAANFSHLKSAIRKTFPQVKSAHLTEAVAAGCGANSHAALLANAKAAVPNRPPLTELNEAAFYRRLKDLGYSQTQVSCDWRNHIDSLPDRLWGRFKDGDIAHNNYWHADCRDRGVPNVYIETRRTLAQIQWDYISLDPADEGYLHGDPGTKLMNEMFKGFQRVANGNAPRATFFGTCYVGWLNHVPIELAADMADMLFKKLYDPLLLNLRTPLAT